MARFVNFIKAVASRPMEGVEAIVALSLFLTGAWLISPFYHTDAFELAAFNDVHGLNQVLGVLQIVGTIPLIYALARFDWPRRHKVRRATTFFAFMLYLFYSLNEILVYGLNRASWLSTLALALIAGVAHLALKWELTD